MFLKKLHFIRVPSEKKSFGHIEVKKPKTRSALYKIEYQFEYILRKNDFKNYESQMTRGDILQVYNITEVIRHKL